MSKHPKGTLVIRVFAMPSNTNAEGDIFGGWLMSQMDLGGAIVAATRARMRVTTVAVDKMVFLNPVKVGDVVTCYGEIIRIGRTSIAVNIETWVSRNYAEEGLLVTEGHFTYVAVDQNGKPHPVPMP
jgi:acyl-CoA thioesterase YciA